LRRYESFAQLAARVAGIRGGVAEPGDTPAAIGLYRSVAALMRSNITQERAGAFFGVSQATVLRRWDLIRPAIGAALAQFVPDPVEVAGQGRCCRSPLSANVTPIAIATNTAGSVLSGEPRLSDR
jgi:hypothetical protein